MAREHRVLSGLAPVLPLAPRSLHYCGDVAIAGAPFQILEYRAGRTVRGGDLAPLPDTAESGAALSRLLIATLAKIHAVDTAAAGLDDLGRPEGFLRRTAAGWTARAEAVLDGKLSTAARELVAWLERHPGAEADAPVLLHNDFKLDNLVLGADRVEVEAVLDWDMATRGDALFDLAALLSYWSEPGDPACMAALNQMPTARPGFLSREAAAAAYAGLTGRSLHGFIVPRVLAMFRLGVVFHQLRALQMHESDRQPRLSGLDADDLFVFALDVANGRAF
jgi:aminoglycoside phosphotransferase (APT) family kinase protein